MAGKTKRGRVTGYLLKLIRESIPRSQQQLALDLGLDRGTVQGWESGRRPFTSVPWGQALALRHRLANLGASMRLISALDHAAEADVMLSAIIELDPGQADLTQHPLGCAVLDHRLTEMLTWSIAELPPLITDRAEARRRGPVPRGPELGANERLAFFTNLHVLEERTQHRAASVLLHRQACFLAGFDATRKSISWLSRAGRAQEHLTRPHGWSARWADARSLAASIAKHGDPEPLRAFIARAHPDDTCELAGLNYWAYWVGEIDQRQRDDMFMTRSKISWRGNRLLRHLVHRLDSTHAFVDLNVHSLWALLAARRGLAHDNPKVTQDLVQRAQRLLDEGKVSSQSSKELASVLYGLRMDGFDGKANS